VNTPTGQWISIESQSVLGMPRLTAQTQPAGSGCAASIRTQAHDANANIVSQDDFGGNRVCRSFDMSRNLELVRVEGLAGGSTGVDCSSVLPPTGSLSAGSRKISTAWHRDWPIETQIAEPGRRTTFVINGQSDPFAGGSLARCAPSATQALVCRRVEQATNDTDGALGFAASLQLGVSAREERWTYNEHGQVLTHDGPRTDIADVTTHEYYTDTIFAAADPYAIGHTRGDLRQTTSPTGHVTRFNLYNRLGQLLEMVDPNGVVTSHTYDLRQRLTSTTVDGQTTTFAYWPTGLIQRITQPDSSWVHYEHDDAHRLVKLSDNLGNSVSYTLDNMGMRIAEQVRDPANVLRRQIARSIDALGRVQLLTGRE
jgi:YD repeat-containing protein